MCVDIDNFFFNQGLKENREGPQNLEIKGTKGPKSGPSKNCEGPQKIDVKGRNGPFLKFEPLFGGLYLTHGPAS